VKKIARSEKIEASRKFAEDIQDSLSRSIQRTTENVKNRGVRRAPFVVLIGANMPSVLAEISFLSNPSDEQLLKKGEYCQVLAEALFQGVLGYLRSVDGLTYDLLARNSAAGQSRPDVISAAPAAVEPARKEHQCSDVQSSLRDGQSSHSVHTLLTRVNVP